MTGQFRERERERANSRDQKRWVIAKWWICENCGKMMGDNHCLDDAMVIIEYVKCAWTVTYLSLMTC